MSLWLLGFILIPGISTSNMQPPRSSHMVPNQPGLLIQGQYGYEFYLGTLWWTSFRLGVLSTHHCLGDSPLKITAIYTESGNRVRRFPQASGVAKTIEWLRPAFAFHTQQPASAACHQLPDFRLTSLPEQNTAWKLDQNLLHPPPTKKINSFASERHVALPGAARCSIYMTLRKEAGCEWLFSGALRVVLRASCLTSKVDSSHGSPAPCLHTSFPNSIHNS